MSNVHPNCTLLEQYALNKGILTGNIFDDDVYSSLSVY